MSSANAVTDGTLLLNEGSSLKERLLLGHHFAFNALRRTNSLPKRTLTEQSALPVAKNAFPLPEKTDCFNGFNRAKSKFFHSCRISSKSSKQSKDYKTPYDNPPSKNTNGSISTLNTCISVEDEESNRRLTEAACRSSNHVATKALSSVPIPPPRALPSCLRKKNAFSESSQPLTPPSQMDGLRESCLASLFEEDHCEDVRIYPVVQNGVKMSDTHYWIINPPRSSSKVSQRNSTLGCPDSTRVTLRGTPIDPNGNRLFSGRPLSFSAKLLNQQQHYENLSSSYSGGSSPVFQPDDCSKPYKLRRGKSENSKDFLRTAQRNLVEKMRFLVPQATPEECRAVLIGSSWDFERAQRRLKLELLCRRGFASKSTCERYLHQAGWDLTEALEHARSESSAYGSQQYLRPAFTFDQAPIPFEITIQSPDLSPSCSAGEEARETPETSPGIETSPNH